MGPLYHPSSSLNIALMALEGYMSRVAEDDGVRWRIAATSGNDNHNLNSLEFFNPTTGSFQGEIPLSTIPGVLPDIRNATQKAKYRRSKRERAVSSVKKLVEEAKKKS